MSAFCFSLCLVLGPVPLTFGIRIPSLTWRVPGLKIQAGPFLLEVFYEFDDVNLELSGRKTFYWSRKIGGWLGQDA